ncbi:Poly(3-hydroxyalkanoate) synthetase [Salinisphaera dokdonensis CL-ES53]|uniref:Poly(3-hydroxyalkanoate) synthetase n=1 Tax=Salinisphaera dokdonensis CL-ES53 TaxID=1304272 RepID=A0ABV2AY80_9GAMM
MLNGIRRRIDSARDDARRRLTNGRDWLFNDSELYQADQTPYEVIHRLGLMAVRYYPPLATDTVQVGDATMDVADHEHATPIVLVPPLAASTLIFDLLPQRSLVRYLRARGFAVYLLDWGEPGRDDAHLGVRDYALRLLPDGLTAVRQHSGSHDVSVVAYCMGGLFSLIYAGAGRDSGVRNIVTIASPVDMHDATIAARALRALNGPARMIRRHTPWRIHQIDPRFMHVPGWLNGLAFKLTNPVGSVTTYVDLLRRMGDRDFVAAHVTTSRWMGDMLDYPGTLVQDFLVKLWIDNALASGTVRLGEVESDLASIDCPLLAIAGESDQLMGIASVRRIMDLVTSPDRRFELAPGGHAGVFAGRDAPAHTWRMAADWLSERSD